MRVAALLSKPGAIRNQEARKILHEVRSRVGMGEIALACYTKNRVRYI